MILRGVIVSRQDEGAGVSLHHRALLVVQDVLYQATRCLLNVCIFLRESIKEEPCKEIIYFLARAQAAIVALLDWLTTLVQTEICQQPLNGLTKMNSTDFVDPLTFHLAHEVDICGSV